MKNYTTYKLALGCIFTLFCFTMVAQHPRTSYADKKGMIEANKRIDDYLKLLKLGYSEREIFEDLGNVNFLSENYETAAFWYQKLLDISEDETVNTSYKERYEIALKKAVNYDLASSAENKDWFASVKEDYQMRQRPVVNNDQEFELYKDYQTRALHKLAEREIPEVADERTLKSKELAYQPPVALTPDGKTAYFSKAVYVKPLYGVFSKKQVVHKIFKAEKVNGEWKNIKEVSVCPKYASATHPTLSANGKRLFFASDMPGTFGEYDIYVSELNTNGTAGIAKNLGQKVNTKKNDLYPNVVAGNALLFASEGRKGKGGLDIYAVTVAGKKVGKSINLGSPINSQEDDFSIALTGEGMGYVMSNRGKNSNTVDQVVFSYTSSKKDNLPDAKEYNLLEVLNSDSKTDYSSTIFEDQ